MTMNSIQVEHPGSYIKEEMEARGWIQRDLAFVLGCNEQQLNAILSGKRGISADMAKALGDALKVNSTLTTIEYVYVCILVDVEHEIMDG